MRPALCSILIGLSLLLPGDIIVARESASVDPASEKTPPVVLYVINHGGHAGIVVKRSDFPVTILPKNANFQHAKYLEIGWGDRDYYPEPDPHLGLLLKAALWPTESVLHIAGFNLEPANYFPYSEIVRLKISESGRDKLKHYFAASFARDSQGKAQVLAPGLYGHSYFYLSRESYHLFKTCNVWTAKALQTSGISITPFISLTTGNLMGQLYDQGIRIKPAPAE